MFSHFYSLKYSLNVLQNKLIILSLYKFNIAQYVIVFLF